MIEIQNIYKKFGQLEVLKSIHLSIESGVCAVLIGPNGCGKTTLLKCMLNMVIPDSGSIKIDEIDVSSDPLSRKNIGFMPQIGHFPENMTVSEVLATIQFIRGHDGDIDYELYEQFEIKSIEDKKLNTLSGGTVQKLSATIAFMFNPSIIIMDEPFAGLDILATDILKKKMMKEKANGKTILITSHTFSEIDEIVSHVISMDNGIVQFYKPMEELLSVSKKDNITEAIIYLLNEGNEQNN